MGYFADYYGGVPSFSLSDIPQAESTGLPVGTPVNPGTLPSWLQTGLGVVGTLAGIATQTGLLKTQTDRALEADYAAEARAREAEAAYRVQKQLAVPTWLILVGVVGAGVLIYKAVK